MDPSKSNPCCPRWLHPENIIKKIIPDSRSFERRFCICTICCGPKNKDFKKSYQREFSQDVEKQVKTGLRQIPLILRG